jgi:hypothetical protein
MFYTELGRKQIAREPPYAAGHGRIEVTDRDHSAYLSPFVAPDGQPIASNSAASGPFGRPVSKKRLVGRHY